MSDIIQDDDEIELADGTPAKIVYVAKEGHVRFPLLVVWRDTHSDWFSRSGEADAPYSRRIRRKRKTVTRWVNVYRFKRIPYGTAVELYDSDSKARAAVDALDRDSYVATVPITWEE